MNSIEGNRQGNIEVSIDEKGRHFEIRISDNGIGIKKEHIGKYLSHFSQPKKKGAE